VSVAYLQKTITAVKLTDGRLYTIKQGGTVLSPDGHCKVQNITN